MIRSALERRSIGSNGKRMNAFFDAILLVQKAKKWSALEHAASSVQMAKEWKFTWMQFHRPDKRRNGVHLNAVPSV